MSDNLYHFIPLRLSFSSPRLPSPHWKPSVLYVYESASFFVTYTSLWYFEESTYKWHRTVFVFLCPHLASCCCIWQRLILCYSSLNPYGGFSSGPLVPLIYVHLRSYFERAFGVLGERSQCTRINCHSLHGQPRETEPFEMENCSQSIVRETSWDVLSKKLDKSEGLLPPGLSAPCRGDVILGPAQHLWRAPGRDRLALRPKTKLGSPANAHQHPGPLPGLRTDTKPPCSPAQTSNEPSCSPALRHPLFTFCSPARPNPWAPDLHLILFLYIL